MNTLTCFFFISIIPYANSITFNFTNINSTSGNLFTLAGDASISPDGIQVTPEIKGTDKQQYTGRATYIKQLHLWDKATNELTSFSTSFSFVIDSNSQRRFGDGITFFLAENNAEYALGGGMGLPFDMKLNVETNPFVAVEFDTFSTDNEWDNRSVNEHVGINVNNISSVRYSKWLTDIPNGRQNQGWIEYDSVSKNLIVSFTNFKNNRVERQDGLYYTIDLRDVLPEWVIFGFTAAAGYYYEKNIIKDWIFNSTDLRVDDNKSLPPTRDKNKNGLVLGLIIGLSVLVIFLSIIGFVLWRKIKNYKDRVDELLFSVEMNNEFDMEPTGPRRFSYRELARSTGNFAANEKLGEGGFGGVYRGLLRDSSTYVAVKRVSKSSRQGIKEYVSEVKIISRLRHRNLVQLIGWCHQKGELLLVYEYMENGSLDSHLFLDKSLLTWGTRYKIAHGLASALLYLHEEWEQCVLHRDIKSSNIMLDLNFNVKLGDFGLAKMVDHEKGYKTTMLAGTLGYMAPESIVTGKASKETDLYSFGVVLLEIACGRKPTDTLTQESQLRLLEWVWELYNMGTLLEAADPRLGSKFDEEEIKRVMIVGLWCVHPDPEHRPSIRQVIQALNSEISLPILPSKMPVASYLTSPMSEQKTPSTTSSSLYSH